MHKRNEAKRKLTYRKSKLTFAAETIEPSSAKLAHYTQPSTLYQNATKLARIFLALVLVVTMLPLISPPALLKQQQHQALA